MDHLHEFRVRQKRREKDQIVVARAKARLEELYAQADAFITTEKRRPHTTDEWRHIHRVAKLGKRISQTFNDSWGLDIFGALFSATSAHLQAGSSEQ